MGFQNPEVYYDPFSPFTVYMSTDTEQGRLAFRANVSFSADGFTAQTVESKFQEFLDFLNGAETFDIDLAQRNAMGSQPITPSS